MAVGETPALDDLAAGEVAGGREVLGEGISGVLEALGSGVPGASEPLAGPLADRDGEPPLFAAPCGDRVGGGVIVFVTVGAGAG